MKSLILIPLYSNGRHITDRLGVGKAMQLPLDFPSLTKLPLQILFFIFKNKLVKALN